MVKFFRTLFVLSIFILGAISIEDAHAEKINRLIDSLILPPGFQIEVYAGDVPGARSMALSPSGILFVGTRREGKVYAVLDRDGDYAADEVKTILRGLRMPNGVALRNGDLYVAEISRVWRFEDVEKNLDNLPDPILVNDAFPDNSGHGWKYIAFGPDDKLYVPVGAPCNVCNPQDERYASIMRMNPDGSDLEVFASGVRNTVGFDWHPQTDVLWFTDNGRDWLGDNRPPDELNRAPGQGLHFGFPYCHGRDIPDPEFGDAGHPCDQYVPPARELGPHVAALGMLFYTGDMFPDDYQRQVFIAEHGSWNRSTPIGYRVMLVHLDGEETLSYEPFAEGWLQDTGAWGRPVDVLQMADGSILVSDDHRGAVYRISYKEETE
ncbi:MAG: PQQ-dependent sugar dehydrogenase [Candidatus Omnitrophota bacterium]